MTDLPPEGVVRSSDVPVQLSVPGVAIGTLIGQLVPHGADEPLGVVVTFVDPPVASVTEDTMGLVIVKMLGT